MKNTVEAHEKPAVIAPGNWRGLWFCTLVLILLTVWLYIGIFPITFMSDDVMDYIQGKRLVEDDLFYPFYGEGMWRGGPQYYRPLPVISHGIDAVLFGYNPAWHRFTQMLLHLANVLLVFALFREWLGERGRVSAITGAFIFALHPAHELPMWWPATRNDVMCCTFFLLAALAFTRHVRTGKTRQLAWAAAATAAALACKEIAYALPLVCFALALFFGDSPNLPSRVWRAIRSTIPLAIVAASFFLFRLLRYDAAQTFSAMQSNLSHLKSTVHTAVRGLLFPFQVSVRELWAEHPALIFLATAGVLIAVAFLVPRLRSKAVMLGAVWLVLTCLPIMRTMSFWSLYIPSVGFCLAAGHMLAPERSRRGFVAAALLAILLTAYAAQWESRKRDWQAVDRIASQIMETLRTDRTTDSFDDAVVLNVPASFKAIPLHAYYFADRARIELDDPAIELSVLSHTMYPLVIEEQGIEIEPIEPGIWRLTAESPQAHFVFTEAEVLPYQLEVGAVGTQYRYAWGTAELAAKHANGQPSQIIVRLNNTDVTGPIYYFAHGALQRLGAPD